MQRQPKIAFNSKRTTNGVAKFQLCWKLLAPQVLPEQTTHPQSATHYLLAQTLLCRAYDIPSDIQSVCVPGGLCADIDIDSIDRTETNRTELNRQQFARVRLVLAA